MQQYKNLDLAQQSSACILAQKQGEAYLFFYFSSNDRWYSAKQSVLK